VDSQNTWGVTPLHKAASSGYLSVVQLLVERGQMLLAGTVMAKPPMILLGLVITKIL
jgi:hypothetical protein